MDVPDHLPPTLFRGQPHYPLPFVSPHSAHILEFYPLLNNLFMVTLRYFEYVVDSLLDWECKVMQPGASNMQEAAHAIEALGIIRVNLSIFLSKVYTEVDRSITPPHQNGNLPSANRLLCNFDDIFSAFGASIEHSPLTSLAFSGVTYFEKIPIGLKGWTNEFGTRFYSLLIDRNAKTLHTYLSAMLSRYEMPKIRSLKWMYTFGAIGVSIFTLWLLRKYVVNTDINEVSYQEALVNFLNDHVKKPFASIREDLFRRVTESDDDQKAPREAFNVYRSMVKEYSGENPLPDDEMSEAIDRRLKHDFNHPVKGVFVNGGLIQAIMIRVQRLVFDYESGRHWISGFFRVNKKSLAFISALPAIVPGFFLLCGVSLGCIAMVYVAKNSERDTLIAMLANVEKSVIAHTLYRADEEGQELDQRLASNLHGMMLLDFDKFYRKVVSQSRSREEWLSMENDLKYLGTSRLNWEEMLAAFDRLKQRV